MNQSIKSVDGEGARREQPQSRGLTFEASGWRAKGGVWAQTGWANLKQGRRGRWTADLTTLSGFLQGVPGVSGMAGTKLCRWVRGATLREAARGVLEATCISAELPRRRAGTALAGKFTCQLPKPAGGRGAL